MQARTTTGTGVESITKAGIYAQPYLQRLLQGRFREHSAACLPRVDRTSSRADLLLQEPTANVFFFFPRTKKKKTAVSTPSQHHTRGKYTRNPSPPPTNVAMYPPTADKTPPPWRAPPKSKSEAPRPLKRDHFKASRRLPVVRRSPGSKQPGTRGNRTTRGPACHEYRAFALRPLESPHQPAKSTPRSKLDRSSIALSPAAFPRVPPLHSRGVGPLFHPREFQKKQKYGRHPPTFFCRASSLPLPSALATDLHPRQRTLFCREASTAAGVYARPRVGRRGTPLTSWRLDRVTQTPAPDRPPAKRADRAAKGLGWCLARKNTGNGQLNSARV